MEYTSSSELDFLVELYNQAEILTGHAESALYSSDIVLAKDLLGKRARLVKTIQRHISLAPEWGKKTEVDLAALSYIRADKKLSAAIDSCCA